MDEHIRPALPGDLAAIEAIIQAAYRPYIARIGRRPAPLLENYAPLISNGRVHVAERNGVVQGILVLIPQADAMLLDNVAVLPEAQGAGLGRMMLAFAEQAAVDAGFTSIKLYTNEAMTENIALYTRHGYAETHRAEEKGLRRVYMRKPLPKAKMSS